MAGCQPARPCTYVGDVTCNGGRNMDLTLHGYARRRRHQQRLLCLRLGEGNLGRCVGAYPAAVAQHEQRPSDAGSSPLDVYRDMARPTAMAM